MQSSKGIVRKDQENTLRVSQTSATHLTLTDPTSTVFANVSTSKSGTSSNKGSASCSSSSLRSRNKSSVSSRLSRSSGGTTISSSSSPSLSFRSSKEQVRKSSVSNRNDEEELVHEIDTDDDVTIMKKSQDRATLDREIVAALTAAGGTQTNNDGLSTDTGDEYQICFKLIRIRRKSFLYVSHCGPLLSVTVASSESRSLPNGPKASGLGPGGGVGKGSTGTRHKASSRYSSVVLF